MSMLCTFSSGVRYGSISTVRGRRNAGVRLLQALIAVLPTGASGSSVLLYNGRARARWQLVKRQGARAPPRERVGSVFASEMARGSAAVNWERGDAGEPQLDRLGSVVGSATAARGVMARRRAGGGARGPPLERVG
jgi:hypothetical protein